jgi:hypothetical protein
MEVYMRWNDTEDQPQQPVPVAEEVVDVQPQPRHGSENAPPVVAPDNAREKYITVIANKKYFAVAFAQGRTKEVRNLPFVSLGFDF